MEKINILVVDDEENIRFSLKFFLDAKGHEAVAASNGREALDIIIIGRKAVSPRLFSLVITDLLMPVMGGVELIKEIRKLPVKIPVLVISGSIDRETEKKLIDMGVAGILPKPFTPDDIMNKVTGILSSKH